MPRLRKTGVVCKSLNYRYSRIVSETIEKEDGSEVDVLYKEEGITYRKVFLMYYNNITRGRAKRIARNHRLPFCPRDCGVGFSKMKDKLYLPCSAIFVYTSHNRRLFIKIHGKYRTKVTSRTIYEEEM